MTDLELAKQSLLRDTLAFVIAKDGVILSTGTREGIAELLDGVDALGDSAHGAVLADRIVGKAVAMVARAARLRAVFGALASHAARDALARDDIPLEYATLVPLIRNQRDDGPCPLERLTQPIHDPAQAVAALRDFVRARTRATV